MGKFIDLTGRKIGRLTVLERGEDYISPKGQKHTQWLCRCECNNVVLVSGNSLKRELTQSCGCLAKERLSKATKKYNKYNLKNSYGTGYTQDCQEFYFDINDFDKIKNTYWFIDDAGYVAGWHYGKLTRIHRVITDAPKGMVVDHINHNLKDNRSTNLRVCTQHQNSMNQSVSKNNKSGTTGVQFDKNTNKWRAYINYNREQIVLGSYDTIEDAKQSRRKAENIYFGEYAYNQKGEML